MPLCVVQLVLLALLLASSMTCSLLTSSAQGHPFDTSSAVPIIQQIQYICKLKMCAGLAETSNKATSQPQAERAVSELLESRTHAFVSAINAREFGSLTSDSEDDRSPWIFLHTTFRADLSGLISRAAVQLCQDNPPSPTYSATSNSVDAVVDRDSIIGLSAYTAEKFPQYRMTVSNASTWVDEGGGRANVFVHVEIFGLDGEVGREKGLVRKSVGEFE